MTDDRSTPDVSALAEALKSIAAWLRCQTEYEASEDREAYFRAGAATCDQAATLLAAQGAQLSALQQERDAFREEANAIRRNYLRETKDLAERADAAERQVTSLTADLTATTFDLAQAQQENAKLTAERDAKDRRLNALESAIAEIVNLWPSAEDIVDRALPHAAPREETP